MHAVVPVTGFASPPRSAQYSAASAAACAGSSPGCVSAGSKYGLSGMNRWEAWRSTSSPMSCAYWARGVAQASAWRARRSSNGGTDVFIIVNVSSPASLSTFWMPSASVSRTIEPGLVSWRPSISPPSSRSVALSGSGTG